MDKIAVLIPCYNESRTIAKVVSDWRRELPEAVIYVYDNNSTDRTDEIARRAGAVVRYEPCRGKGAAVLFLLATVFFIPVMTEYLETGLVPNFPTLIVCGYCVIVAFLSWFAGLILQTLIQKDRQAFEFRMQICQSEYAKKKEFGSDDYKSGEDRIRQD